MSPSTSGARPLTGSVPYTSASKGDLVQVIVEPYNGYAMNSLSISERNYWGSSVDYWQSWKHDNVYYFYHADSDVTSTSTSPRPCPSHIVYVDRAANRLAQGGHHLGGRRADSLCHRHTRHGLCAEQPLRQDRQGRPAQGLRGEEDRHLLLLHARPVRHRQRVLRPRGLRAALQ